MIVSGIILYSGLTLASASPAPICPATPAPAITVNTARQKTEIRRDLGKEELKTMRADTDLPYQMQDMSHVETGGLMRGDIKIGYAIDLGDFPVREGENCVRYKSIAVTLELDPEIFIARDYAPDSCWFKKIFDHEESHIDMDQVVINKYAARIRDGLSLAFSAPGDAVAGPVGAADIAGLKKSMGENVMEMVGVMARDMIRERRQKQQAVDSAGGYAYIMKSCYSGDAAPP